MKFMMFLRTSETMTANFIDDEDDDYVRVTNKTANENVKLLTFCLKNCYYYYNVNMYCIETNNAISTV